MDTLVSICFQATGLHFFVHQLILKPDQKFEVSGMSNDLEKIAAVEAAAAAKLKAIKQKRKAIERAENDAKKMAIGDGVQRAIKAGDMDWSELKIILKKHIKGKRDRSLLNLSETVQDNSVSLGKPAENF